MDVQLLPTNAVSDPPVDFDDLRTEDISIEPVRTLEIAHRDDDVVQAHILTIGASGCINTGNGYGVECVARQ